MKDKTTNKKEANNKNVKDQTLKEKLDKVTPGNLLAMYTLGYLIKKDSEIYPQEILDETKKFITTWNVSHGTYYPMFKKLKDNGYVNLAYIFDSRKYYQITEAGRAYYEENADRYKELLEINMNFYNSIMNFLP